VRAECAAHALTVQEPYGVWGGFTEAERLRLQDCGWDDLVDRRRGRADVRGLEQRLRELGPPPAGAPAPHQLAGAPPRQRSAAAARMDAA
jgi:WhiB family redox-sensing transcriptional regulator